MNHPRFMMRKYLFPLLLTVVLLSALPLPAKAASGDDASQPLCPPGVQRGFDEDCYQAGPTQYLTEMAEQGLFFPLKPLPVLNPDPALSEIEYNYARVTEGRAPIFATLDAAINNNKGSIVQRIRPGFNFIAYTDVWIEGGKRYYKTDKGWATSDHAQPISIPQYQGLEFAETPERPFGWALNYFSSPDKTATKRTPGFEVDDYTGHHLEHLEVVQIYKTVKIDGWNWYMIAPDEWIFQIGVAIVTPHATPPEGVSTNRWIEVDLYEQTLVVYENQEMVFATLVATGTSPNWTYPGLFQIYEKLDTTPMRGGTKAEDNLYYAEKVPWTMYFDDRRALHGAYWRAALGFTQSHGCVNLSVGDSRWLYEWADVGDWIYVWDPSGETPFEE